MIHISEVYMIKERVSLSRAIRSPALSFCAVIASASSGDCERESYERPERTNDDTGWNVIGEEKVFSFEIRYRPIQNPEKHWLSLSQFGPLNLLPNSARRRRSLTRARFLNSFARSAASSASKPCSWIVFSVSSKSSISCWKFYTLHMP